MSSSTKRRGQNVAQDKASRTKRRKTSQGRKVVGLLVGTSDKRWWKSSGLKAGDQIPVSDDRTKWRLKRAEDNPWWSFHIKPAKGKDLYVTYNRDDQNVTLESEISAGREKFFVMLLQPENKYILADPSSLNKSTEQTKFLGVKDGKLAMVEAADVGVFGFFTKAKITDDSITSVPESKKWVVEIQDSVSPVKWIASRAQVHDRVRVNQSNQREEWIFSGSTGELSTFQVSKRKLYASRNEESKYDVLYEYGTARQNLRKFMLINRNGSTLLRTAGPDKMYVAKDVGRGRKYLQLKENEVEATRWNMVACGTEEDLTGVSV